ncbi:MAG: NACHT domain-containing protein [Chlorobiales bacterium]|nr:NACHT domain-containing protein [Chlorobiales bacterium]
MSTRSALEKALRDELPSYSDIEITRLAACLIDIIMRKTELTENQEQNIFVPPEVEKALGDLMGRQVTSEGSVLTFGEENQFGNISIRDVAGRITNINLNFHPPLPDTKPSQDTRPFANIYFHNLIEDFSKQDWATKYINLQATIDDGSTVDVSEYLTNWATSNDAPPVIILGEFGTGKTWACKRFACHLAESLPASGTTPIFIPLIRWFQQQEDKSWLERIANSIGYLPVDISPVILNNSKAIIILDGIDEVMASSYSSDPRAAILKLFNFPIEFKGKIIITARNQYLSLIEQCSKSLVICTSNLLEDRTSQVVSKLFRKSTFVTTNGMLHLNLLPLQDQQVDLYFNDTLLLQDWKRLCKQTEIQQLARKPVTLYMLEKALPFLQNQTKNANSSLINQIYYFAFNVWIARDTRGQRLNYEDIHYQLEGFAKQWFLWNTIPGIVPRQGVHINSTDLHAHLDLLTEVGILKYEHSSYSFAHQSFFEYFFSVRVGREILAYNSSTLAQLNLVYMYTINQFLISFLLNQETHQHSSQIITKLAQRMRETAVQETAFQISRYVTQKEFNFFVSATGWRLQSGWGSSTLRTTKDGDAAVSNLDINTFDWQIPDLQEALIPVTSISWYDAWLFARAVGGRLPLSSEISGLGESEHPSMPAGEWCEDWHDEANSLMQVFNSKRSTITGTKIFGGANPDIRDSTIGFRVIFMSKN